MLRASVPRVMIPQSIGTLPFFLRSDVSPETRQKIKDLEKEQEVIIDSMRKKDNDLRDEFVNLYKKTSDVVAITSAEAHKTFVSQLLGNMVSTVLTEGLPLPTRSILKLYQAGCPHCVDFVNPLSYIARLFPHGTLAALEVQTAMNCPRLNPVLERLTNAGWNQTVPAWFAVEPDTTGDVRYVKLDIPSWGTLLRESGESEMSRKIEKAQTRLANLLKEKLVVNQMAKDSLEMSAEIRVRQAKDALLAAERRGETVNSQRRALENLLNAERSDPVAFGIKKVIESMSDREEYNIGGLNILNDDSTLLSMMSAAPLRYGPAADRLAISSYITALAGSD